MTDEARVASTSAVAPQSSQPSLQSKHSSTETRSSNADSAVQQMLAELSIPISSPLHVSTYFNDHFPTEDDLVTSLPTFVSNLDAASAQLDAHLASLMRSHRHDSSVTHTRARNTTDSLSGLRTHLATLADSAQSAHAALDTALAPAQPVHTALSNVTTCSRVLHALTQLDDAVTLLESAAAKSDLASLDRQPSPFVAVETSLATLSTIPEDTATRLRPLPPLRARATVARETIRAAILSAFKRYADAVSNPQSASSSTAKAPTGGGHPAAVHADSIAVLSSAARVADAMGSSVRSEVMGAFVRRRRAAFSVAFRADDDASSGLVAMDRRLAWLRREMRTHWAQLSGDRGERGWGLIFPARWGVARRLVDGLVAEVRDWVVATLTAGADRDVAVMVSALRKAKEFEVELDRRFGIGGSAKEESFAGGISDCFSPWMHAYVRHEDEHLSAVLTELLREETWTCDYGTVLKSATELLLVIKKSMLTCAALDIRQTLFSLHRVFKKHLALYASALIKVLPVSSVSRGVKAKPGTDSGLTDSQWQELDGMLRRACAIVNTAEYCGTTMEQLEESLRKTVEAAFEPEIDMSVERERFGNVSAKGIASMVTGVEQEIEKEVRWVSEQKWANVTEVGDTSKYVHRIGERLGDVAKKTHEWLSRQHFRFLLEKLAAGVISRVRVHLYRCEGVTKFGAQQMLLDVSTLRGVLVGLPASVHAATASTFVKFVNREMGKIEAVVKVMLAPREAVVETYAALVVEGSAEDLQRVLEMRGLKRAEAAPLVLEYSRRIGRSQRLRPVDKAAVMAAAADTIGSAGVGKAVEGRRNVSAGSALSAESSVVDGAGQSGAVDSMKNLLGRWMDGGGITDRLGQVSSQLESTTDRLKKEAAAARWSLFGK